MGRFRPGRPGYRNVMVLQADNVDAASLEQLVSELRSARGRVAMRLTRVRRSGMKRVVGSR